MTFPRKLGSSHTTWTIKCVQFGPLVLMPAVWHMACSVVIYLQTTDSDGICESFIVCAKTRVAPTKPFTIHYLELIAAQLLSKLIICIATNLGISSDYVYCFSDSKITFWWITKPAEHWHVFVANQVRAIQSILPASYWVNLRTQDNPADLPPEVSLWKSWSIKPFGYMVQLPLLIRMFFNAGNPIYPI